MDTRPLVSVLMPAMNCHDFLVQAVESLRAQTYENWQLCISAKVEDGTHGDAWAIAHQEHRVLVSQEERTGFANNVNQAFRMSRGPIIARLESDDWNDPTRLEKQVALLMNGYDICSCGMVRVLRNGALRHMDVGGMKPFEFCTFCCPHGPGSDSIVAWRWVYDLVGLYDPRHDASADTDWTFRALLYDLKWGHVAEDLYYYRDHKGQMTKRLGEEGAAIHLERQAYFAPLIRARLGEGAWK